MNVPIQSVRLLETAVAETTTSRGCKGKTSLLHKHELQVVYQNRVTYPNCKAMSTSESQGMVQSPKEESNEAPSILP